MIDNAFRAIVPRFAGPLLAIYTRLGWTPNHVSALGFGIALAASFAVAMGHEWVALTLWWVSRAADGTDGVLARATGQESDFGAYLDTLCIASALALGMQEAKRALPARDDRGLRLGAGLAEGGETGIAYSIFLLFPAQLALTTPLWVAILAITIVARSILAYRSLDAPEPLHEEPPKPESSPRPATESSSRTLSDE
jgi:hypothetical protein